MNMSAYLSRNRWRRNGSLPESSGAKWRTSIHTPIQSFPILTLVVVASFNLQTARAQYPTVPKAVQDEANARKAAADKGSDEAFAKAFPIIKEWEAKGKPYLPGAAAPKSLP